MKPHPGQGAAVLDKALSLFLSVLHSSDARLSRLAAEAGIPASTAQRIVAALMRQGLLSRTGRGSYAAGLRLAELGARHDPRGVLAAAGRPLLRQLARTLATTAHLGVLEGDMVSYLVKEQGGGPALRTREANQLEAYCTGIGKVLLAALDEPARDRYLATGPFVRLTARTLTGADPLCRELQRVGAQGFAADGAEFEDGLYCLAVPVHGPGGGVVAAISASGPTDRRADAAWLGHLQSCAARIGQRLGAPPPWRSLPKQGKVAQRLSRPDAIGPP